MTLDTSGNWVAGDDLRVMEALLVPFGSYTIECIQNCMAQLEEMSSEAVLRVRELLDEYDVADAAEGSQNIGNTEGKTLVKADVLEWEVTGGKSGITGPTQEKNKVRMELWNYFAFCVCLGNLNPNNGNGGYWSTKLVRS